MAATPPAESRPPSAASLSKTPSWIMLGFLLGGACVLALWAPWKKSPPPLPAASPPVPAALEPVKSRLPPRLLIIEDVFATWGQHAVWDGDTTEIAFDAGGGTYSELYEVRRRGDILYFRTIPRLTRRVINRGKPTPECPLQFTETEEQYREWLEHGRKERK